MKWIAGIFVGGTSSRMGSPKGLLPPPDGSAPTLVERLARVIGEAGVQDVPYLVGVRSEYAHLPMSFVADVRDDSGPLSGLVGLLRHAQRMGAEGAVVLACDFPYVRAPLVRRLMEEPEAEAVVCPYVDDRFQPLFARYRVQVLPSFERALGEGRLSLQPLIRAQRAWVPTLSEGELAELRDWDTPEDVDESGS